VSAQLSTACMPYISPNNTVSAVQIYSLNQNTWELRTAKQFNENHKNSIKIQQKSLERKWYVQFYHSTDKWQNL